MRKSSSAAVPTLPPSTSHLPSSAKSLLPVSARPTQRRARRNVPHSQTKDNIPQSRARGRRIQAQSGSSATVHQSQPQAQSSATVATAKSGSRKVAAPVVSPVRPSPPRDTGSAPAPSILGGATSFLQPRRVPLPSRGTTAFALPRRGGVGPFTAEEPVAGHGAAATAEARRAHVRARHRASEKTFREVHATVDAIGAARHTEGNGTGIGGVTKAGRAVAHSGAPSQRDVVVDANGTVRHRSAWCDPTPPVSTGPVRRPGAVGVHGGRQRQGLRGGGGTGVQANGEAAVADAPTHTTPSMPSPTRGSPVGAESLQAKSPRQLSVADTALTAAAAAAALSASHANGRSQAFTRGFTTLPEDTSLFASAHAAHVASEEVAELRAARKRAWDWAETARQRNLRISYVTAAERLRRRQKFLEERERGRQIAAIVSLQRVIRRRLRKARAKAAVRRRHGRTVVRTMLRWRDERRKRDLSAIQAAARIARHWRAVCGRRAFAHRVLRRTSATAIQRNWRRYVTQGEYQAYRRARLDAKELHTACLLVQRSWRLHRRRRRARREMLAAIRQIQRVQRIYRNFLFKVRIRQLLARMRRRIQAREQRTVMARIAGAVPDRRVDARNEAQHARAVVLSSRAASKSGLLLRTTSSVSDMMSGGKHSGMERNTSAVSGDSPERVHASSFRRGSPARLDASSPHRLRKPVSQSGRPVRNTENPELATENPGPPGSEHRLRRKRSMSFTAEDPIDITTALDRKSHAVVLKPSSSKPPTKTLPASKSPPEARRKTTKKRKKAKKKTSTQPVSRQPIVPDHSAAQPRQPRTATVRSKATAMSKTDPEIRAIRPQQLSATPRGEHPSGPPEVGMDLTENGGTRRTAKRSETTPRQPDGPRPVRVVKDAGASRGPERMGWGGRRIKGEAPTASGEPTQGRSRTTTGWATNGKGPASGGTYVDPYEPPKKRESRATTVGVAPTLHTSRRRVVAGGQFGEHPAGHRGKQTPGPERGGQGADAGAVQANSLRQRVLERKRIQQAANVPPTKPKAKADSTAQREVHQTAHRGDSSRPYYKHSQTTNDAPQGLRSTAYPPTVNGAAAAQRGMAWRSRQTVSSSREVSVARVQPLSQAWRLDDSADAKAHSARVAGAESVQHGAQHASMARRDAGSKWSMLRSAGRSVAAWGGATGQDGNAIGGLLTKSVRISRSDTIDRYVSAALLTRDGGTVLDVGTANTTLSGTHGGNDADAASPVLSARHKELLRRARGRLAGRSGGTVEGWWSYAHGQRAGSTALRSSLRMVHGAGDGASGTASVGNVEQPEVVPTGPGDDTNVALDRWLEGSGSTAKHAPWRSKDYGKGIRNAHTSRPVKGLAMASVRVSTPPTSPARRGDTVTARSPALSLAAQAALAQQGRITIADSPREQ